MIGTEIIRAVLKTVFGDEHYFRMYEVVDDDMIRKSAIDIVKRKEYENGDNEYVVKINWRLLDKFVNEGGEE